MIQINYDEQAHADYVLEKAYVIEQEDVGGMHCRTFGIFACRGRDMAAFPRSQRAGHQRCHDNPGPVDRGGLCLESGSDRGGEILTGLGFETTQTGPGEWQVAGPTWRGDVSREAERMARQQTMEKGSDGEAAPTPGVLGKPGSCCREPLRSSARPTAKAPPAICSGDTSAAV